MSEELRLFGVLIMALGAFGFLVWAANYIFRGQIRGVLIFLAIPIFFGIVCCGGIPGLF